MNRKLRILGLAALALALAVSGAWAADVTVDGGTATWENATGFSAGSNVTGDGVATDNTSVVTLKNGAVVTATTTGGLAAKELILEDSTLNLTGTGLLTLKDGANAGKIEVSGDSKIVLDGNQAGLLTLGSNSTLKIHAGVKLEVLYKNDGNTATISGTATTLALQGPGKLVLGVKVDNDINHLKGEDGVTLEFAPGGVFFLLAQDVTFDKGSIVVPNTVKADVFPAMNGKSVTLKDGNLTIDAGGVFGETAVGGINKLVLESGDLKLNATDALSKNVKNIELKDKATAEINKIGAIQAEGAEVLKDEFSVPTGPYYGSKPAKINSNVAVAMDAFEKGTTTVKVKKGGVLKVNARQLLKTVKKDTDAGKVVIAKDAVLYVGDDTAVVDVDVDVEGEGALTAIGDKTVTLSGNTTYKGKTTVIGKAMLSLPKAISSDVFELRSDFVGNGIVEVEPQNVGKLKIDKAATIKELRIGRGKTSGGSLENAEKVTVKQVVFFAEPKLKSGFTPVEFKKEGAGELVLESANLEKDSGAPFNILAGSVVMGTKDVLGHGEIKIANSAVLEVKNGFELDNKVEFVAGGSILKPELAAANKAVSPDVPAQYAVKVLDSVIAGAGMTLDLLLNEPVKVGEVWGVLESKSLPLSATVTLPAELAAVFKPEFRKGTTDKLFLVASVDVDVPTFSPAVLPAVELGKPYDQTIVINSKTALKKILKVKDIVTADTGLWLEVSADAKTVVVKGTVMPTFKDTEFEVEVETKGDASTKGFKMTKTFKLSTTVTPEPGPGPTPTPGEPALVLPSAATQVEGGKPMAVEFVVMNAVSEDIKSPMATAGGSWDVPPSVAFARDIVSGDTVMALKGTPKKGFGTDTVTVKVTVKGKVLSGDIKLTEKTTPPTPQPQPEPGPTPQPQPQPGPTPQPQPQPGPTPQPQPQPGPTPQPQPQPGPTPQPQPQPAPGVEVTVGTNWTKTVGAADASGHVPVELRTTLTSNSTPTKVDVVLSGMTLENVRLLNSKGGEVRISANAETYTLIVTGKAHKDALATAKVVSVAVTTVDGFGGTKPVDKTVDSMPEGSHGGSGGGGCDAGVGGLALALVGAFLLRRKA